jgi:Leucine-rich repeat (LRR) protein
MLKDHDVNLANLVINYLGQDYWKQLLFIAVQPHTFPALQRILLKEPKYQFEIIERGDLELLKNCNFRKLGKLIVSYEKFNNQDFALVGKILPNINEIDFVIRDDEEVFPFNQFFRGHNDIKHFAKLNKIPNNLQNLRILKLYMTNITAIPESLVNLVALFCERTRINTVSPKLTNLKGLFFSKCFDLRQIPSTLTNLECLVCRDTEIKEIPDTLVNLTKLCCDDSKLEEIPVTLTKLEYLTCNRNKLVKKIPDNLINLRHLSCYREQIKYIPKTLTKLRYLCCGENKELKEIPEEFTDLTFLECAQNPITDLSQKFTKLKKLHIENTQITEIPKTYTHLFKLHCTFPDIYKIPLLPNLEYLVYYKRENFHDFNLEFNHQINPQNLVQVLANHQGQIDVNQLVNLAVGNQVHHDEPEEKIVTEPTISSGLTKLKKIIVSHAVKLPDDLPETCIVRHWSG